MPNSLSRPLHEVQKQRIDTLRKRYGKGAVVPLRDITSQRFGRLLAVNREPPQNGRTMWMFLCDCGRSVVRRMGHVVSGKTTSCGCRLTDESMKRFTTHGHTAGGRQSKTFISWSAMVSRCTNKKHKYFKNYGGRGITVCARWRKFDAFLSDMGERPDGRTLDRIDTNGHYEPGNCRWATWREQRMNQRR